jgi:hypothetical protein
MIAEFVLMVVLGNDTCCRAEHYVGTFNSLIRVRKHTSM